ncbi:MAG: hypothetical protein KC713_10100, partial [Candidatus Omnitrophica bacterium]|nr:hypothetical protein [Candidatus Omnitrophota bacterium]
MIALLHVSVFLPTVHASEIINVNDQYKVAFSDLTSPEVQIGDIIVVYVSPEQKTYLEVYETNPIMSKLGPVKTPTTEITTNFSFVRVGTTVAKNGTEPKRIIKSGEGPFSQVMAQAAAPMQPDKNQEVLNHLNDLLAKNKSLLEEMTQLKSQLAEAKERIDELKNFNNLLLD